MSSVDCVLLHAPSVYDFRERSILFGPVSDMVPSTPIFEMYPLGFTTMAEYMERHGLRVRIVNLAVLMLDRPGFDVDAAIRLLDPVAFGIDLHWLPHAHGAVEVARIVKKHHPDTPVIFGGLSASFFHDELIAYDCVDYVVRGDSTEQPMTRLMQALKGGGCVDDVPNLTWKAADGSVNVNPLEWVPSDMDAISLDYSFNFKSVVRYRDVAGVVPFRGWLKYPVCAALTSRGCTHDCATCGGSAYAFREHYGRERIAFRDPELLVRDIEHIQRYIPGPIFVLNDFLQAGRDYTKRFVKGLQRIKLRNPIGFEFFKPPHEEFFEFLDAHLDDYNVEISVESHDDDVRAAFGKRHYAMEQVEESVRAAMRHGCKRFDVYFMTGLPTQTADSIRETPGYVEHLYDVTGNDPRVLCMTSPMAPFLDPGSMVFDEPERFGFRLRARTLEQHRQLLVQPSWKHILNYEPDAVTRDDLVEATYDAALGVNRVKAAAGVIGADRAADTEQRVLSARRAVREVDEILDGPLAAHDSALRALKERLDRLSESTVCEKSELEWPHRIRARHVAAAGALFIRENAANLVGRAHGRERPAVSEQHMASEGPAKPSLETPEA
jgi:B12-binding domain/radical SAM domain protein